MHKSSNQYRLISRLGLGSLVSFGLGGWWQSPLLAEIGAERLMEMPVIESPIEIPIQIPVESPVEIPITVPVAIPAQIPGEIAAENSVNSVPEWQNSPVFRRWQQQVPNVLADIENDPSFRTRWRLGYGENNQQGGVNLGVEDIFLIDRLTLSGDYQTDHQNNNVAYGAELRYYLLPLGNYVNVAPVLGYRQINAENFTTNGARVGGRVQVVLSRPSAADIALSQTWVALGSSQEVAITDVSLGYALTHNLRVGTQWQLQQRGQGSDRRLGIFVEFY